MTHGKSASTLDSQDWGWVAINIGMGIGAGIVFLPIQAGLVGLWTFLLAILIAYPALYLFQRLFVCTLVEAPQTSDYAQIITAYLGRHWGRALGGIYFLMLAIWLFVYSETVVNDSASYLQTFGLASAALASNHVYSLGIICLLLVLAFASRALLLNLSKALVVTILSVLLILSVLMIRFWEIGHIMPASSAWHMIKEGIITLPFAMTSILFLQSLSPMVIYSRSRHADPMQARTKALQIMNRSFFILALVVFLFAFSCTLSVTQQEAVKAFEENTSFLALMAKVMPGQLIPIMGISLDILAVMTSFFGVLLGFHEACMGLIVSLFYRDKPEEAVNRQRISAMIIAFTAALAWTATILDIPILYFTPISSPIFAIIGCFIPVLLIYSAEPLRRYRDWRAYIVVFTGLLLFISPFLNFTQH